MEEIDQSKHKLKKLVKFLSSIRGRHTELVTVYVPVGYSLSEISGQLRNEAGTAENIKSKSVRKNVTTSLDKIVRHLQLYKKTPEHGLAIFCGNISEKEGKDDIQIFAIEPPDPVKVKMYWCDQKFVLDPLMEMIKEKEVYGIICLDKNEADIAILKGKKIESLAHFESIVPGKTRAGGQSSMRFVRVREGMLHDWLKKIGEASNKIFEEHKEVLGILVSGSGPIKEFFLRDGYLHADVQKRVLGVVDTSYTGDFGLHETVERGGDLLKEASVVKEKKILQHFFEELQKTHGLVAYGIKDVLKALRMGAVNTIIVTDEIKAYKNGEELKMQPPGEQIDLVEFFEEEAKRFSSKVEVVSKDTREGEQFLALGGVGALLRYALQ